MSDKSLFVDDKPHELKFGASFEPRSKVAYHSIRYDFKPASVDTTKEALVEIGEGHHVTLTVPHVEGSGKPHTVYKGNKRPVSKECVLIIDHDTGTFTLERLKNNINVKKTRELLHFHKTFSKSSAADLLQMVMRADNSSRSQPAPRPLTPVEQRLKSSPKIKSSQSPTGSLKQPSPPQPPVTPVVTPTLEKGMSVIGEISDTSSDEDSGSSDSESDQEQETPLTVNQPLPVPTAVRPKSPNFMSMIKDDLTLSESDSD